VTDVNRRNNNEIGEESDSSNLESDVGFTLFLSYIWFNSRIILTLLLYKSHRAQELRTMLKELNDINIIHMLNQRLLILGK
jgi:hypothetical protein